MDSSASGFLLLFAIAIYLKINLLEKAAFKPGHDSEPPPPRPSHISSRPSPETAPRTKPSCTKCWNPVHCDVHPSLNQKRVQGRTISTNPNSMQNKTYTTTKTRCSHTGISAVFSGRGPVGCAGVGSSRFVEVIFKGNQGFVVQLYLVGCNRRFYAFSAFIRLATSRKSIFEPYTSMKFVSADLLSPAA